MRNIKRILTILRTLHYSKTLNLLRRIIIASRPRRLLNAAMMMTTRKTTIMEWRMTPIMKAATTNRRAFPRAWLWRAKSTITYCWAFSLPTYMETILTAMKKIRKIKQLIMSQIIYAATLLHFSKDLKTKILEIH